MGQDEVQLQLVAHGLSVSTTGTEGCFEGGRSRWARGHVDGRTDGGGAHGADCGARCRDAKHAAERGGVRVAVGVDPVRVCKREVRGQEPTWHSVCAMR